MRSHAPGGKRSQGFESQKSNGYRDCARYPDTQSGQVHVPLVSPEPRESITHMTAWQQI